MKTHIKKMRSRQLLLGKQEYYRATKNFGLNKMACLERDGFKCTICGRTSGLHVHHITARSHGGTEHIDNLVTLCSGCHATVTNSLDEEAAVNRCIARAMKEVHKEIEAAFSDK